MRPIHLLLSGLLTLTAVSMAGAPPVNAAEGGGPELIEALRANGAEIVSAGRLAAGLTATSWYAGGGREATASTSPGTATPSPACSTHRTGRRSPATSSWRPPAGRDGRRRRRSPPMRRPTALARCPRRPTRRVPLSQGVPLSRAALFERSASAFGFTLGERGPPVVLFGDAACSWSRAAAARLGREALAGRLQLRVVPVAVLGAAAARLAAGIAASADPASAWFEGATRPADRHGAERIARNNALLDEWGANAVPLIAWTARDGAVGVRVGDIDDVGAWLRETGLE